MPKTNILHPRGLDKLPTGKRHHDGGGLYLDKITAQPRWVQRLTLNGKPTWRAIGPFPAVSLRQAREQSAILRTDAAAGELRYGRSDAGPTFRDVLGEVIQRDSADWRPATADQWRREMNRWAGTLMAMPVAAIVTRDIVNVLEAPGLPRTTAERLRRRIVSVMRRARGQGYRDDNPADDRLDDTLPKRVYRGGNHAAVHFAQVPAAFAAVRNSDQHMAPKLAALFTMLTAARGGEVRGMRWSEVDHDAGTWTIPGARTKTGKEHVIPLSRQAMSILAEAMRHGCRSRFGSIRDDVLAMMDSGEVVFVSRYHRSDAQVSNLARVIRKAGIDSTMHGFRSAFRTWAVVEAGARESVAEAALAHAKANSIIAAYERTTFLEARVELMQQWADFIAPDAVTFEQTGVAA